MSNTIDVHEMRKYMRVIQEDSPTMNRKTNTNQTTLIMRLYNHLSKFDTSDFEKILDNTEAYYLTNCLDSIYESIKLNDIDQILESGKILCNTLKELTEDDYHYLFGKIGNGQQIDTYAIVKLLNEQISPTIKLTESINNNLINDLVEVINNWGIYDDKVKDLCKLLEKYGVNVNVSEI